MYPQEFTIAPVTTSTGGSTAYSAVIRGALVNVAYEKDATDPFTTGVDFTITLERLGLGLWTESDVDASKIVSPTQPIHDLVGVARVPSTTAPATEIGGPIAIANDRVKVVIGSGGSAKTGTFRVIVV